MMLERIMNIMWQKSLQYQMQMICIPALRHISTTSSLNARAMRNTYRQLHPTDDELEDLEKNDMNVHDLADLSTEELQHQAERINRDASRLQKSLMQHTIKQKYFKEDEPKEENLLTWEMKEQLKYLHNTDPDEWTLEALAAAFPISVLGVKKLLRTKWVPENEAAIEKHDRAVLVRWRRLTNGRLGSMKIVEETLSKKLGRTSDKLPVPLMDTDKMMSTLESLQFENHEKPDKVSKVGKMKVKKVPKMRSGSFVSIIEDYEIQVSQNKAGAQGDPAMRELNRLGHVDASAVVSGPPSYDCTYSKISSKNLKHRRSARKMMTLDEFLQRKSGS